MKKLLALRNFFLVAVAGGALQAATISQIKTFPTTLADVGGTGQTDTTQTFTNFASTPGVPAGAVLNSVTLKVTINENVTDLNFTNSTASTTQTFTYLTAAGFTLSGTAPASDITSLSAGLPRPGLAHAVVLYSIGDTSTQNTTAGQTLRYLPLPLSGAGLDPSIIGQYSANNGNNVGGTADVNPYAFMQAIAANSIVPYAGTGTFTLAYRTQTVQQLAGAGGNITFSQNTNTNATFEVDYGYTVPAVPDLTVSKSHTGTFTAGQVGATFTVTPHNIGGAATTGTSTLVDTPPAGFTITAMSGSGWTCTTLPTCTTTATIASGADFPPITVTGTFAATATGTLTNLVTVSGGGETNTANDTATDSVTLTPDLTISKTHAGTFTAGQTGATFTVTPHNSAAATGATSGTSTVVDTPPAGFTITAMSGSGWTCTTLPTCTSTAVIPIGGDFPAITVTGNIASTASGTLNNLVTVSGGGETNTTNDTATDSFTLTPDLTISKTHSGTFTAGQTGITFTVTPHNSAAATGATSGTSTVVDTPPAGLTITAMAGSGWTCTTLPTCTSTAIIPIGGDFPPITVTGNLANTATGTLTNLVTVSGGGETNTTNDTATDPFTLTPDLTISKSHAGTFTAGQVGAVYTVTPHNIGTGASSGTSSVVDTPPAGFTITAMAGTGWTCTVLPTCTSSQVVPPAGDFNAITVTGNWAAGVTGTLTNLVTVSGGGETNTTNDTATDPATFAIPDLTVTKSHAGSFSAGQTGATYSVVVHNIGTGATIGTSTLVDTPPAGFTITAMAGVGWTCTTLPTCASTAVVAANADFAAIIVTGNFAASATGTLTNLVTVSGGGETNTTNDTATDPVVLTPDLTISKSHAGSFTAGQVGATYTVTPHNIGNGASTGISSVVDTPPAGFTITAMAGTGWTCAVLPTCTSTQVVGPNGDFNAITVTGNVASTATGTLTNLVTVSGGGETNTTNDTATDPVTLVPDLTISKSHAGIFTAGQAGATYTVTPHNIGTGASAGTSSVVDTPPAGFTITAMAGTGWTCAVLPTCTSTQVVSPAGDFNAITVTGNWAVGTTGTRTNLVTVSGGGETNTTNDTATDPATFGLPDLTVSKSHAGPFSAGQTGATYSVVVHNIGNAAVFGTSTLVDTPPPGFTITAMSGTGWTCTVLPTCTSTAATAANADFPAITVTGNFASSATGTLTNLVTVSGGGETNTTNDTATDPVTLTPDLTISKTHTGSFSQGQTNATFTVTPHNIGTGASTGTSMVVDTAPAGYTITSMSGAGWTCAVLPACTTTAVVGAGGDFPAITVVGTVSTTFTGTMTNLVTVSLGGETNTSNDTATDPVIIQIVPVPDMTITKSHTGNFVRGQVGAVFTIGTQNVGTNATSGLVSVTDTPSAGMTATAISGPGWTCTLAGLTCTRSDVLLPGAFYPPITVTMNIAANAGPTLINTGVVGGGGETNLLNDTANDPITLITPPDLTITKSHTGNFTQGQIGAAFSITASNLGPASTNGTVSVVDTLPAGLTATAISGTGWSCALATLTCTRTDVLAAAAAYPVITVTVNVAATATGTLVNTAVVGGGSEINLTNDTATDPVTIVGTPDMTITKAHTGTFVQGGTGTWTIGTTNVGPAPTSGVVTVVDTLPAGITATAIAGAGWTCTLANLTCTRADVLAAAAAYPAITVNVLISATATGTLTNVANVSGGSEVNLTNDTASDPVVINGLPDMTIIKSHSGAFVAGQAGSYSVTASNIGTAATTGLVSVTDTLPAGLTATAMSGSGWTCVVGTLTCTRSDVLAVGAAYPVITVGVNISAAATGTLVNTAVVGGGGETNLTNDTATDPVVLSGIPDMTITKSHTGNFTPGQNNTFTITASNIGLAATAGTVTVTDTLPAGLTGVSMAGSGWTCTVANLSCTRSDVLAIGAAYPAITLTVAIDPAAKGTLVNTAVVGGGGETNLTNDTATDPVIINALPDLTITKTHTGTFTRGGTGTYTVTVLNAGALASSGAVTVNDTLPSGLTATAISGTGWTCTLTPLACTRPDVLAVAASFPAITVTVSIAANAPASVINTAVVSGGSDSNPNNNTATDPTTLTGGAPLLNVTKVHTGTFIQGGDGTYTITVTNDGTAPTSGDTTVTDTLPAGLTGKSITGVGWNCTFATFSCTRSDVLAAGAAFPPVTIGVHISPTAPAGLVNVATVAGPNGGRFNTSDNTVVAPITPALDLQKTSDRRSAVFGDVIGYTLTATNKSPGLITSTQVQDQLPQGFVFLTGSAKVMTGSAAAVPVTPDYTSNTLTFNIGTMSAGEVAIITYRVRITAAAHPGANINTAQMSAIGDHGGIGASATTGVSIDVSSGLITLRQFIIGRVFEDTNGNGVFDKDERPVAGARVFLSDGQSATTDSKGLYNIPSVAPGSVTVTLDAATIPKGYTISSGNRKDAEDWSRLQRTPLGTGAMLRQNFGIKRCQYCQDAPPPEALASASNGPTSDHKPVRIQIAPGRSSLPADGRSTMGVTVRLLDENGVQVPAKEIRIRTSAGEFIAQEGQMPRDPQGMRIDSEKAAANPLFGRDTQLQAGRTAEQVPERTQAAFAKSTQGEATFVLLAANTVGTAQLIAESGDPDHLIMSNTEVSFVSEVRKPVLSSIGEITVGRAARDYTIYGQNDLVARHADAFLRTPLAGSLLTLTYTSHLTINDSAGNAGLFQLDPLERVYQVFGDSSTQYQYAQSNTHVYGRLERGLSYALFGDLRTGYSQTSGPQTLAPQSLMPSATPPVQTTYGIGDYNRNLTGAMVHLENKQHDSLTLEGARPNTAFARDVFPGSTFGLIQLAHSDILAGSETASIEVRDVHNPEILLSREPLVRSVDYSLDPVTGGVFFLRTLNTFDQSLNLVQVVFTYEYTTIGFSSSVYGLRAEKRFPSFGLRIGLGITNQRDAGNDPYFLGDINVSQRLPHNGNLTVEVPVSHGSSVAAGLISNGSTGSNVNGYAIRAGLDQPLSFMSAKIQASVAKTDQAFFNPFGATTLPGSQTTHGSFEFKPFKVSMLKLGFTDERNKTSLVSNQRQTGSLEWKQWLTEKLVLTTGFDYRDYNDAVLGREIQSSEIDAGLEWKPTSKFSAGIRREQNLEASDPTYPNTTLLTARYQATETVRLFATQRFSSAPIVPIGDLSSSGFAALAGKNETSIGIEDRWSRYASVQSRYMIENGMNGTDTFAVVGLINRFPIHDQFSLDLGLERGELLTGKDRSFNSGSVGFSWLPKKNFRASTRYEIRDKGGVGQIFTTGAAGRIADGLTLLGRFQYASAVYQPGTGAVDYMSTGSTNSSLLPQTNATQATGALAWRPWKTDREGLLFSYTLRSSQLDALQTTQPQNDHVQLLSTDGYVQATKRIEFYGKFAWSDRTFNYAGADPISSMTYLVQGRAQARISRRFDAAIEGRTLIQPGTSITQSSIAAEAGFWVTRDLRLGLGYNFRSADEIAANFLTNPIRQGVYFVISSKLSNLFNLFNPGAECGCAAPAPVAAPAPKPVANIVISPIAGAKDVCSSDNTLRLSVTASGWLPEQTPVYQWFVDDRPVDGAHGTSFTVPTTGSGTRSVKVMVTAGDVSKTSERVTVRIKDAQPPAINFAVSPATIAYGDKLPLAATATLPECGCPAKITYTASEGAISNATFDSSTMSFDTSNRIRLQSKVVHLTAIATDCNGRTARATADLTVTLTPQAKRLDDIVFTANSSRVNNCGKRLLIDELTPMLKDDPNAKLILIGHRDTGEKVALNLDEQRVLNSLAVLSAGSGVCQNLDLGRVLVNWVGTDQSSDTRPAMCGSSTNVKERPGQKVAESDKRAQFRRVEIWLVPAGAEMPAGMAAMKTLPEKDLKAKGCPR